MHACVDVDYRDQVAVSACVLFREWEDEVADACLTAVVPSSSIAPYVPGQLCLRELPCLMQVLDKAWAWLEPASLGTVIVDGFVWLGDESRPGLGAHLFEALSGRSAVIGVAKTCFRGAGPLQRVYRGGSERPLLVSAVGLGLDEAAARIEQMHGAHRIPTLLKAVDRLCRTNRPDETDGLR